MNILLKTSVLLAFSLCTYANETNSGTAALPSEYSLWNLQKKANFYLSGNPLNEKRSAYPLLLITLPRSGTNFLIGTLSYGLTSTKEWCGRFIGSPKISGTVEEDSLEELLCYNGISWCHAEATPKVTSLLEQYDLPITVQMRDPRQAVLSFLYHMKGTISPDSPLSETALKSFITHWFPQFIRWMESWIAYSYSHPERVQILLYEDMFENVSLHLEKILCFQGIPLESFDWSFEEIHEFWRQNHLLHFRKGENDEWRRFFTPEQIQYLNNLMPDSFFEIFPFER